jgi:hypothetical protein
MFKTRRLIVGLAAVAACAAFAGSASAANLTGNQIVGGTTLSTLSLGVSTPAVTLSNFGPGQTASGSGNVVVTSTNPWSLTASDSTNGGHMAAVALGCTGSEATTSHALSVATTGLLGGTTSDGPVSLSGTDQEVAHGSFADTLTNAYSLLIDPTEVMLTGCAYNTTITYTVQ